MEAFEFADAPVSFGQLAIELVQCGSMLGLFPGELYLQPMHASLDRLHLHHQGAELFELRKASFGLCQPVLQVEEFLFLHFDVLLRCGAPGVGLSGFLCVGGDRRVAVVIPLQRGLLFGFHCRYALRG